MTKPDPIKIALLSKRLLFCSLAALPLIASAGIAQGPTVHGDDLFELGDGIDPAVPGIADILGSEQPGPDWDDLFNTDRTLRDEFDELGNPGSNGVPDFLDTYGAVRVRRDASFIFDDISAGVGTDQTTWVGPGQVGPAIVEPSDDLGNVYAYSAFNRDLDSVLYLGAERLSTGNGRIVFELNRSPFSIDPEGTLVGQRSLADLQLEATFVSGILVSVELRSWELVDPLEEAFGWLTVENLPLNPDQPAEQCNDSGAFCVVCNGAEVLAGSWPSFDDTGSPVSSLLPDSFIEIGINLSRILGHHTYENFYETRFVGLQVSTDSDYASGTFARAVRAANSEQPAS